MESESKETEVNDRPFWIGFSLGWIVFVAANLASYIVEYAAFLARQENSIEFSAGGYSWGFPLKMYMDFWGHPSRIGFEPTPTIINLVLTFALSGFLGLVFQKLSDRVRGD